MHVAIKFMVNCRSSLSTILWRSWAEPVLGTIAKTFDDPRQAEFLDDRLNTSRELFLQSYCFGIKIFG